MDSGRQRISGARHDRYRPGARSELGEDACGRLGDRGDAGATHAAALAYAVVVRFVLFVPITVIGLAALVARYGGLRRLSAALR